MGVLPRKIIDTYDRYKNGTNTVISWLLDAAKSSNGNQENGRKTGQQEKADAPVARLRDLVPLATKASKSENVPAELLGILKDVIQARHKAHSWYQHCTLSNRAISSEQKNDTHLYFIGVLQEVLNILQGSETLARLATHGAEGDEASPPKEDTSAPSNLYEYLELEEPLESLLAEPEVKDSEASKPSVVHPDLDVEIASEEKLFALFCFFKDAYKLHEVLIERWSSYSKGLCSLVSASLTTTAAMDLIREANEDLVSRFPEFADHGAIFTFLKDNGYDMSREEGAEFPVPVDQPQDDDDDCGDDHEEDELTTDLGTFFGYTTWYTWFEGFDVDVSWMYSQDQWNQMGQSSKKMQRSAMLQSQFTLLSYIPDNHVWLPSESFGYKILHGFRIMRAQRICPSWLVWAFEMAIVLPEYFLDYGTEADQAFQELQTYTGQVAKTLSRYFAFSRTCSLPGFQQFHKNHQPKLLSIVSLIGNWTKKDIMKTLTQAPNERYRCPDFFLLKNDPTLCGLIMSYIQSVMHVFGIQLANTDGHFVFQYAHMYNAVWQSGLIDQTWIDMEALVQHQSEKHIFFGSRPVDPNDVFNRLALAIGISPRAFAEEKRLKMRKKSGSLYLPQSTKAPRDLKITSPYLRYNWQEEGGQEVLYKMPQNIPKLLLRVAEAQMDVFSRWEPQALMDRLDSLLLEDNIVLQWQKYKKLNQVQLLKVFADSLDTDEAHLAFDYFAMFFRCARLHQNIRDALLAATLPTFEGMLSEELSTLLPFSILFHVAYDNYQEPLVTTSQCIKALIEREGDAEIQQLSRASRLRHTLRKPEHAEQWVELIDLMQATDLNMSTLTPDTAREGLEMVYDQDLVTELLPQIIEAVWDS